jgi:hypothetical protein
MRALRKEKLKRMRKKETRIRLVIVFLTTITLLTLITGSMNAGPIVLASKESSKLAEHEPAMDTHVHSDSYATTAPSAQDVLSMTLAEDVAVQEDGHTETVLVIDVPTSALADAYRKSLGVTSNMPMGREMPIPDNITLSAGDEIGGQATDIMIPVKAGFCESIEHQQETSLGLITKISTSSVVPRNSNNGCTVYINATGLLPISAALQADSNYECAVDVRPPSPSAIAGSVFSSLEMAQMMLESLPEEQSYECLWSTKISLPPGATLLNTQEISGLEWKITFGGGTYITASVTVEDASTIVLNEKTVVTEHPILAAPHYLYDAFSLYKTFSIKYQMSRPALSSLEEYNRELKLSAGSGDAWSYTWTKTWSETQSATFTYGPLSAELSATASLSLSGYVGWDFDLFQGLTSFESWMSLGASIQVDFEASASASYSKEWEKSFFEWKTTYSFMVGVVPVWADMEISATGVLSVNAYGQFTLTAGATASGSFKAGVRWTSSQGWSSIFEVNTSTSYTGPTFEAEAGVCIRPSIRFRISFLSYGVAGPFIEFEPYAQATVTCTYPPPHGEWEITVNLRITAGATFAGWLKYLLGLDDWSVLLYDAELARWSGSWGSTSISITETLDPSTSPRNGTVRVFGRATFNDGSPVTYIDVKVVVADASWTTITNWNGEYSQYISAPMNSGSYTVYVDIATGSLAGSNSRTLTVEGVPPPSSRYTLFRTTTCKDITSGDDPIDETMVFRRTDVKAVTNIHLTDIYENGQRFPLIKVKMEFYDPAGSLYGQEERTVPDPGEGYYWLWWKWSAWIWIAGYNAADKEGRYHTKVYIDQGSGYELKVVHEFVIGYEVTDRTMAKNVQTSYPYTPSDRTNAFLNTYPKAWGWIRLDEVAESLEIKWEWFEPSGAKYDEFYWTTENPSSYSDWYKAWCWIAIEGLAPESKLGLWQVKAYIKDVYGTWDLEYSQYFFIADNTPPGASGTPSDGGDYSTTGTVTWTWTAAPEDGTVAKYQIQIGTTPAGNDVFDGYINSLIATIDDLPSGVTYYARVRAMNTVGQWGPWSGNSDGIIVDRPPVTIMVEGPSETINYYDVLFTWKGTDDVTPTANLIYSYYLQGKDTGWSTWQSTTSVQYNNLPDGDYEFLVKAKDQHGNEDPTPANTSFTVAAIFSVLLESEEDTKMRANLGTIQFVDTNYSLPAKIETRRTLAGSGSDIVSLPGGRGRTDPSDPSLDGTKLLNSISLNSSGQTITVNPGETISVNLNYQLWAPGNPTELDQLFIIYSWTPSWPPSSEYYHGVYHGMPGLYPGASGSHSFTFTAPSSPGTYYLYWCSSANYSIPQGVSTYTQALSPPGHAKIVVKSPSVPYIAKYYPDNGCLFSHWETTGGVSVSVATNNPAEVTVSGNGTLKAVFTKPPSSACHLVVRGNDNRIYCRIYGGSSWTDWTSLPGATCDCPAATLCSNELHIVVRGMDGYTLWHGYVNLTDNTFSGWTWLSGWTPSAPTLASNGTVLCLVVRGGDNRIYYRTYSFSPRGWNVIPSGATCDSPAAAMLGSDLHIVVRGMDGNSLWDIIVSCDGAVVRDWSLLSGATPSKPVLACSGSDNLCLVVRGMDNAIYYRSYTGSTDSWGGWSAVPIGATNDGPGATVMGNELCAVVRGSDGNTLWCADVDLGTSSFSGWTLLSGSTPSAPTLTS